MLCKLQISFSLSNAFITFKTTSYTPNNSCIVMSVCGASEHRKGERVTKATDQTVVACRSYAKQSLLLLSSTASAALLTLTACGGLEREFRAGPAVFRRLFSLMPASTVMPVS